MIARVSSNKFASFLFSAILVSLIVLVLVLMLQVRALYHDHLKLHRLQEYKIELDSIQSQFDNLGEDIEQTMQLSQVYKNARVSEMFRLKLKKA